MVVFGTGLDVVKAPVMLITRIYKDDIKKFRTVCLYFFFLNYEYFRRLSVDI